MRRYLIGLDAGTTSVRTVLYDVKKKQIVCIKRLKFKQYYPNEGWVEHDANEIYKNLIKTLDDALSEMNVSVKEVLAIGIATQRETVVAWDRRTGEPICPAIVWQCRRTSDACKKFSKAKQRMIHQKTGLRIDPYFSATKMQWILENVPMAKVLLQTDNLCLGTVDSFIAFRLSDGKSFVTDTTNASRTMLMNIYTLTWDDTLLKLFHIPKSCLPTIQESCGHLAVAQTSIGDIPICAMIADQQSSLFGQGCTSVGMAKNTYGSGSFTLVNTGDKVYQNKNLLSTVAWTIQGKTSYALEGSVFCAGANLEWLRDGLGLIKSSAETAAMAEKTSDTNDVYFVPALTGLGAPYWDSYARGLIIGLTRATTKDEVVRAVLESLAYSVHDLLVSMSHKGIHIQKLRVDGGVSTNSFLTQFQADLSRVTIQKQVNAESTVLGAVYLAGLGYSYFSSIDEITENILIAETIEPKADAAFMQEKLQRYHEAVARARSWSK